MDNSVNPLIWDLPVSSAAFVWPQGTLWARRNPKRPRRRLGCLAVWRGVLVTPKVCTTRPTRRAKSMILLIGNYALDRQQSMQRFATMMFQELNASGVPAELIQPEPFFGRF